MTTPAPASPTVVADDMQFLALAYSWASALNGMATELPAPYGHLRDLITPSDLTWFGNSTPMSVRNGLSVGIRRAVHDQNDPNQVGVEIRVFPPEVQIGSRTFREGEKEWRSTIWVDQGPNTLGRHHSLLLSESDRFIAAPTLEGLLAAVKTRVEEAMERSTARRQVQPDAELPAAYSRSVMMVEVLTAAGHEMDNLPELEEAIANGTALAYVIGDTVSTSPLERGAAAQLLQQKHFGEGLLDTLTQRAVALDEAWARPAG
ncbi:hypothetical protein [Variovorax gossypii]